MKYKCSSHLLSGAKQSADPSDPSSKKAKQEEEMVPEREDDLANVGFIRLVAIGFLKLYRYMVI